jgi:phosphoribosylaminoimidazole carboxylase PurE protein
MGSDSDLRVMAAAAEILDDLKIPFEVRVVSAHRTPRFMLDYAEGAEQRGIKVIIAGAGGAAHLPGMVASATTLPVIGVPIDVSRMKMKGLAQMPKGVPVATMAVDNAFNAGLLAARILALTDKKLKTKLVSFTKKQTSKARMADTKTRKSYKRK